MTGNNTRRQVTWRARTCGEIFHWHAEKYRDSPGFGGYNVQLSNKSMNTKLVLSLTCFAAAALTTSAVNAASRGGGHGGHFTSMSPRGGQTFSGARSGTYRNWSGRTWSGNNWSGRNWSGSNWRHHHHHNNSDVIFIGDFGFPFWGWGWGYPYGYYGGYGYGYGNGYGYGYDGYGYGAYGNDYGRPGYGSGYGDRSRVVELQRRLARAGYYHGAIDGIMGSQTRRAIRAFERSRGELSMR